MFLSIYRSPRILLHRDPGFEVSRWKSNGFIYITLKSKMSELLSRSAEGDAGGEGDGSRGRREDGWKRTDSAIASAPSIKKRKTTEDIKFNADNPGCERCWTMVATLEGLNGTGISFPRWMDYLFIMRVKGTFKPPFPGELWVIFFNNKKI